MVMKPTDTLPPPQSLTPWQERQNYLGRRIT